MSVPLRLLAALAALGAGVAGVLVTVALLRSVPGPPGASVTAPAAPAAAAPAGVAGGRIRTPDDPAFPSPPGGAVVLAREAGANALGLAVAPTLVRVSVVDPNGDGVAHLRVAVALGTGPFRPAGACGAGCYQLPARPRSTRVTVRLGAARYAFALPRLPARGAGPIVARAAATWNALRTLVWHERLASDPTHALTIVYRAQAPDALAYTIAGASSSVIIDGTRWDRPGPGAPWQRSPQNPPVRQPQPYWQSAVDAYVLGAGTVGGRRVWRVSFFDPLSPAWFEASVDRRTYRTLELTMIAAAHFMHDRYGPFDRPFRLLPPT